MNPLTHKPRPRAAKASWAALGLALGCAGVLLVVQMLDQMLPFERTRQGLLTGYVPRAVLYSLWAGEVLATVVGIGSFLLIRKEDIISKAIFGIVARSLIGIAVGLFGMLFLWLVVGHIVVGF